MGFRDISGQRQAQEETQRQRALNLILGGIGNIQRERETERQKALAERQNILSTTSQLRNQGFDVTPEQVGQALSTQDGVTGLGELFARRTPEFEQRQQDVEAGRRVQKLQERKLQQDLELRQKQEERQGKLFQKQLEQQTQKIKKGPIPKTTQFQAATFGKRLEEAEKNFQALQAKGFERAGLVESFKSFALPDAFKSEDLKRQEQAERNFVNAVLRRESGAAIAESEFESAEKQYFPRAGDSPAVLRQKANNRQVALAGLKAEAGPAFQQVSEQFEVEKAALAGAPQRQQAGMGIPGIPTAQAALAIDPKTLTRAQKLQLLRGQQNAR